MAIKKLFKKLFFSLPFFILFLFLLVKQALAQTQPQLIFINHVRGNECCDEGSLENFQLQLDTFTQNNLPAFFAVRYDALKDVRYRNILMKYKSNPLFQFGVMLEVTPQLAKDAFVQYKDDPENPTNWFQAQNAFLIGYSPEDRKLLADKIVETYTDVFQTRPQFSTAWQVDTPTLNYLHEEYGLQAHQIAREQWGLDSYTLDGGPPHYPYLASKNWFFNPDFSDSGNLLIIRHTIDDSLYTYGDDTSSYTSQPNDYSLDGKDFSYFEKLLDQVLDQKHQTGFANLGLENSMAKEHQQEYQRQIKHVAQLQREGKVNVNSDILKIKNIYADKKITIHQAKDLLTPAKQKVYFVTAPNYRLRIRFKENDVFISDLRVYDQEFEDPYTNTQAINKGYLVNPYLINDGISFPQKRTPTWGQRLLGMPVINSFSIIPKKDVYQNTNYFSLPTNIDYDEVTLDENSLIYQSEQGQTKLAFGENYFLVEQDSDKLKNELIFHQAEIDQNPIKYEKKRDGGNLSWRSNAKSVIETNWTCDSDSCYFQFSSDPSLFEEIRHTQYPFIFPEKRQRQLSDKNTLVYVHNRYAIAGRNPVRVILVPQDKNGFPTSTKEEAQVITTPEADLVRVEDQTASQEYQILDVSHNTPQGIKLELQLDDLDLPTERIYFAPDCKTNAKYCLTHPRHAWWYLRTVFADKIRLKLLDEKQD